MAKNRSNSIKNTDMMILVEDHLSENNYYLTLIETQKVRVVKLVTRQISIPAARVRLPPGETNKKDKKLKKRRS